MNLNLTQYVKQCTVESLDSFKKDLLKMGSNLIAHACQFAALTTRPSGHQRSKYL